MYAIHTTEGIIIDTFLDREVDCFYYIYTRDYGLVGITATGIRLSKSKYRGTLQLFTLLELSFVKGKNKLRLTHAKEIQRVRDISKIRFLARLLSRVRRMVRGEEKNESLYTLFTETIHYIDTDFNQNAKVRYGIELLFTIRLLHALGYWAEELIDVPFLNAPLENSLAEEAYTKRELFVERVQNAIAETQL